MNKSVKYVLSILCILGTLVFQSCSSQDNKVSIVCTTTIVADVVNHLKPPSVSLMGPGVDPHLYKSKSGDHSLLNNAKIIVYSGLHLEGKMTDALENLSAKKPVINLTDGITEQNLMRSDDFAGTFDPHFWFDIRLFQSVVKHCGVELQKHFPEHKDTIAQNTKNYLLELDSLANKINILMHQLPVEKRILITAHDAFSYYGKAYNIKVKGIQGASTAAEAGLKDITNLVDYIIKNHVSAIFVESSVSKRNIEAIIEGCKKKGHHLSLGGSLYSDALGSVDTGGETYVKMMIHNTRTIVNALNQTNEN
ncbi:MAG: manganese/zinc/iron transport system substrate-binding protein [Saprospiraceae bacterium]|jgi:manganese/zinc/iron transport system substrate-binding protein